MCYPELTVVEYIDQDLLVYICKFELPKRYRSSRTDQVDAKNVHDWVMSPRIQEIEPEDTEDTKKLKKLTYNLGGENGVHEVQQMFIEVIKIIRKFYRLETSEKVIIDCLVMKIKSVNAKWTIVNILNHNTPSVRKSAGQEIVDVP